MKEYREKCHKLTNLIDNFTKNDIVVAFSGGVDSCLLLKIATECAKNNNTKVFAVTIHTMLHSVKETDFTVENAAKMGAVHKIIQTDELLEAGIEYNNRKYKELDQKTITFFKYHRHYETAIDVFSQSHEDMDITIRRLAQTYYVVKKSLIPNVIVCKAIGRRIGIDENTKQIIDEYFWKPFGTKWIWSRPLWKMFNTVSREELPEKDWKKW